MWHLLERAPASVATPSEVDRSAVSANDRGSAIRCSRCGHFVTRAAARTEAGGAHEHAFMNPAGFAYVIRCFDSAPGCVGFGPDSDEWAWFPGHRWRVTLCGDCRQHLGWSFSSSTGGATFYGLIVERLTFDDAGAPGSGDSP